jgi:hypothetical protein
VAFVDYRNAELRAQSTATPLVCLLYAALPPCCVTPPPLVQKKIPHPSVPHPSHRTDAPGFLRDPTDASGRLLLRPCVAEMVRSHELLDTVDQQFDRLWTAHAAARTAGVSAPASRTPPHTS